MAMTFIESSYFDSMSKEERTNYPYDAESLPDVEVFRTSVDSHEAAQRVLEELANRYPWIKANFDLEDVDKILRIEHLSKRSILEIIRFVNDLGFTIEVLPD